LALYRGGEYFGGWVYIPEKVDSPLILGGLGEVYMLSEDLDLCYVLFDNLLLEHVVPLLIVDHLILELIVAELLVLLQFAHIGLQCLHLLGDLLDVALDGLLHLLYLLVLLFLLLFHLKFLKLNFWRGLGSLHLLQLLMEVVGYEVEVIELGFHIPAVVHDFLVAVNKVSVLLSEIEDLLVLEF